MCLKNKSLRWIYIHSTYIHGAQMENKTKEEENKKKLPQNNPINNTINH